MSLKTNLNSTKVVIYTPDRQLDSLNSECPLIHFYTSKIEFSEALIERIH